MLVELLAKKRQELAAEEASIDAMLRECARDHVTPAKDYWHRLEQLRGEVKAYERAVRENVRWEPSQDEKRETPARGSANAQPAVTGAIGDAGVHGSTDVASGPSDKFSRSYPI